MVLPRSPAVRLHRGTIRRLLELRRLELVQNHQKRRTFLGPKIRVGFPLQLIESAQSVKSAEERTRFAAWLRNSLLGTGTLAILG